MRKRERENPCAICGHYHKYEEGEACGVCGHRLVVAPPETPSVAQQMGGAFPSEILKDFLYLGSYDNASRGELLKSMGITHILNVVPACQNLYKNTFTYHCLQDDKSLQFDDAIEFLEKCEKDKARVLVHCMLGKSRSPAIVIAYLMKCKRWPLAQSYQWVKERRQLVDLAEAVQRQLLEYEHKIFSSNGSTLLETNSQPSFRVGFPKPPDSPALPAFNLPMTYVFQGRDSNSAPVEFTFASGRTT